MVREDHRDAYLIGRLAVRLDCYLPERAEEAWARLRHLGARRFALVADVICCTQQVSDLQVQAKDGLIVISTYGRGMWVMDALKVRAIK